MRTIDGVFVAPFRLELFRERFGTLLVGAIILALLTFRDIPTAPDDGAYLDYFTDPNLEFGTTLISFLVDEPLFRLYAFLCATIFDPTACVRLLIALTVLPHLHLAATLPSQRGWLYLAGFLLIEQLAFQMGWNQLRQGFALSVFIALCRYTKRPIVAACVAALVHSSMVFVAVALFVAQRRAAWLWVIAGLALLANTDVGRLVVSSEALGRRELAYLGVGAEVTPFFFVGVAIFAGYVTLFCDKKAEYGGINFRLYASYLVLFLVAASFDAVSAFAGRLLYFERWIALVLLVVSRKAHAEVAAAAFIALNVASSINESLKNPELGYFDRVALVLHL